MRASSGPSRSEPVTVRVLAYQLKDRAVEGAADGYRLVTTLLNARRHPARQLAALYRERWGATRSRTRLSELPDRRLDLMSTA
ncbi:hypothetical protein [Streptomyces sp. NPDC001250]|uniref:hypothetical protein n=1 Tax=unclassified Streptomyces TaxID=2593676 RepID=UPI0033274CDA